MIGSFVKSFSLQEFSPLHYQCQVALSFMTIGNSFMVFTKLGSENNSTKEQVA